MEYCHDGNLMNFIHDYNCFELNNITVQLQLMKQAAMAVQALHSNDIVHGDIKPANFLVNSSKSKNMWMLKICDFEQDNINKMTPAYSSEYRQNNSAMAPTKQCDIYSLGVTMLEIITRRHPSVPLRFDGVPLYLSNVIQLCCQANNRPSIEQVIEKLNSVDIETPKSYSANKLDTFGFIPYKQITSNYEGECGSGSGGKVSKGLYNGRQVAIKQVLMESEYLYRELAFNR